MQLVYLVLFLCSIILNAYATKVIIMDYSDLEPGRIYAYDIGPEPEKECFCYDKY